MQIDGYIDNNPLYFPKLIPWLPLMLCNRGENDWVVIPSLILERGPRGELLKIWDDQAISVKACKNNVNFVLSFNKKTLQINMDKNNYFP